MRRRLTRSTSTRSSRTRSATTRDPHGSGEVIAGCTDRTPCSAAACITGTGLPLLDRPVWSTLEFLPLAIGPGIGVG